MILLIGIVLGLTFNAEIVMKSYSQPTPTPVPTPSPGSQGVVSPQAQQQQQQQSFEQTFQELHKQKQKLEQQIQQEQQRSPQSQELQSLQQQLQELRQQLEQLQQIQSPQAVPAKEEGHLPPLAPTQQQPQQQQQSPTATPPMAKFKVKIDSIKIHSDHDPFASGEWRMFFTSNAQQIKVDTPNGAMWDVDNGETVVFPNLFLNVAIPTNGVIFIDTLGEEVDGQETKIPAIPAAVRAAFVAGAVITGNPLAATYTGYLDKARSVLQSI